MPLVVVGETGLIGRAIINKSNDDYLEFKINQWTNENLSISLRNLETSWIKYKEPIDLVWAAGKSSNSSNQETLDFEIELVNNFLNLISNSDIELRSLSLISSAGSIFGGYDNQIITEDSIPKPISLYGKSRLEIESRFSSYANKSGTLMNIFRLTNVFGIRQTLKNDSGLLSHLIAANLTRKELNIFVPLFVEQDYIDVDFVADNINQILRKSSKSFILTFCPSCEHTSIIMFISSVLASTLYFSRSIFSSFLVIIPEPSESIALKTA